MSRRRLHHGHQNIQSAHTVDLNRCRHCGTMNPSLPGVVAKPEKCAGCGVAMPVTNTFRVGERHFKNPQGHAKGRRPGAGGDGGAP